jgi:hypothetical protein
VELACFNTWQVFVRVRDAHGGLGDVHVWFDQRLATLSQVMPVADPQPHCPHTPEDQTGDSPPMWSVPWPIGHASVLPPVPS